MRVLKWIAGGILGLAALLALAAFVLVQMGERKRARIVEVAGHPPALDASDAARARGRYLFVTSGCAGCHGANGGGAPMIDGPNLRVKTPDISPSGATARYGARDWDRAVRHCVKPDGRPSLFMPCVDYNRLTDADLAAIIAHVGSLPPANGTGAEMKLPAMVLALYAIGRVHDDAEKIDHALPPSRPVEAAVTPAHGAYVANRCIGCHRADYSGGKIPGGAPGWPAAANLTPGPGSVMPAYDTAEKFKAMMRGGKRPDGTAVSEIMPFESLRAMSDVDLDALYAFLKTLPARPVGGT